ncbi:uncharacterized protein LOC121242118 [Juglans microcarpa x Juglans regia]|uniref:uncharacterized protein LOC121242118 n=1 Tax=Juglans microcarpa x Juglans regia TaxID=2249226 RepID=UPI001B7EF3AF|nr:uncharacterized protein LOC121242118 [Juglans microcarpa x Juglans regia]
MYALRKIKKINPITTATSSNTIANMREEEQSCTNPSCFFCNMKEPASSLRRSGILNCFKEIPLTDNREHVLVLSSLWHIAMTHPDDPEFPSLGIFKCMAKLIYKGLNDRIWLLRDQNMYIPYYAAHVIGSYTMNKAEFAEMAVESGVIPPLMELLRGKISWVEQRVAVRALGHLASYEKTFEAVSVYEEEVVNLAMKLASTCLEEVFVEFVGVKNIDKRLKYHRDLLTRGVGDSEMEDRKAEEWASQLQCWSIYLLNCFACKERSLNLICRQIFLRDLCDMWGGLVNHASPAWAGLVRILCYSKDGRKSIAESKEIIENLCNLSRSSDDWQYMGIDCLLLLLTDQYTRYRVLEKIALFLIDLAELGSLGDRSNLGEAITKALLLDYKESKLKFKNQQIQKALQDIWNLKAERRKENLISEEKIEERRVLVNLVKQEANHVFWLGEIEEALAKYTEALDLCPLKLRKERMVLHSNRAQCHLLLRDPDSAISDSTRALCLSNPANSHSKSLWRRSQAYDMKGLPKESLMDCIMFINGCMKAGTTKRVKIPYYAARMISKQMDATWLFATARSKITSSSQVRKEQESDGHHESKNDELLQHGDQMTRMMMENKECLSSLSTIIEEPNLLVKEGSWPWRKVDQRARRSNKAFVARSM